MGENNIIDPRETGVRGLSGLRGISAQINELNKQLRTAGGSQVQKAKRAAFETALEAPVEENVGLQYPEVGNSRFDKQFRTISELSNPNDARARLQSGFEKIVNGITKGAITAGTTFLDGTVGLAVGLEQGIENLTDNDENTGFWSGLWNNSFSKTMQEIQRKSEELLPNYYTDYERENPLATSSIFSANFIGDKFLKNIGFTVGAFYSGGLASGAAKGLVTGAGKLGLKAIKGLKGTSATFSELKNIVNTSEAVAQLVGAGVSALNEGRIEALNTATDWYSLQKAQLDDSYNRAIFDLSYLKRLNPVQYELEIENLTNEYNQRDRLLQQNATRAGNLDLLLNMAILMPSNLFQFGKLYARGFDSYAKGIKFDKSLGKFLPEQEERTLANRALRGGANALSEAKEEVLQQIASDFGGAKYTPSNKDFFNLSFSAAEVDPVTGYQTLETSKALMNTISQTLSEDSTWEQFIIGGLTGALGMPVFGKSRTGNAYIGQNKAIGIEGGLFGELIRGNEGVHDNDEIINQLNSRIQDPNFQIYYKGLLRHNKFENAMKAAALAGDRKTFKDSEYAQMVSDIQLFADTGQLDAYKKLLNDCTSTAPDNLQSIVEITSAIKDDGNTLGPFIDSNGNQLDEELIKDKIQETKSSMLKAVSRLENESATLDAIFGNNISREAKNELIWLKLRSDEAIDRASNIAKQFRPIIEDILKEEESILSELSNNAEYYNLPLTGDQALEADIHRNNINTLNSFLKSDDKRLTLNLAANYKLFNNKLESISTNAKTSNSTKESIKELLDNFKDIPSLIKDHDEYYNQYNHYIENIVDLTAKQEKEKENALKEEGKHKAKELSEKLKNSTTVQEAAEILNNSDDDLEVKDKAVKDSNNSVVTEAVKVADKVNALSRNIAEVIDDSALYADIIGLLNKFKEQADSTQELSLDSPFFSDINNLDSLSGESFEQKKVRFEKIRKAIANGLSITQDIVIQDSMQTAPDDEVFESTDSDQLSFETIDIDSTGDSQVAPITPVNPSNSQNEVSIPATEDGLYIFQDSSGNSHIEAEDSLEDSVHDVESSSLFLAQENSNQDAISTSQEKYNRPAIGKYTLGSMRIGPNGEAPKWSSTEDYTKNGEKTQLNSEWARVHSYLESKGAFEFIDSGNLARYKKDGGEIYFGVDPEFDTNLVLMFAKLDDNTYQVIGSNFMSKSKTDTIQGLTELNSSVLEAFKNANTKELFISPISTTIKEVKEGRIKYTDDIRATNSIITDNISDKSLGIVIQTTSGLIGDTDNVRGLSNASKKLGMAYMTVPNSAGTKSLIPLIPVGFSKNILDSNNYISKEIDNALNILTSAILSKDRAGLSRGLKALFKYVKDRDLDISLSKDNAVLYLNQIMRDSSGNVVLGDSKKYPRVTSLARIVLDSTSQDVIKSNLINALEQTGANIRINKNILDNRDYIKSLLKDGYTYTHAVQLNTEASWFLLNPIQNNASKISESVDFQAEISSISSDKRRELLNKGRKKKFSIQKPEDIDTSRTLEQARNNAIKELRNILPQLANSEHIQVVDKLLTEDGLFANGVIDLETSVITLSKTGLYGTAYHEAYHYVSQLLLNDKERDTIYREARSKYGNLSNFELEEKLADGFRDYMISKENPSLGDRILNWFKKLYSIVTRWNPITTSITGLYQQIEMGKFANAIQIGSLPNSSTMYYSTNRYYPSDKKYYFDLDNPKDAAEYEKELKFFKEFASRNNNNKFIAVDTRKDFDRVYNMLTSQHPRMVFKVSVNGKILRDVGEYKAGKAQIYPIKPLTTSELNANRAAYNRVYRSEIEFYKTESFRDRLINEGYDEALVESMTLEDMQNLIGCKGI